MKNVANRPIALVDDLASLRTDIAAARLKAVAWLTDRIDDDGRPDGADRANSWWRTPWALTVAGAPDVASAVLGWIEREALTEAGALRQGPYGGDGPGSPAYLASPIAIAAWLLGRYGTARAVMDSLDIYRDESTGGVFEYADFTADPLQDMLKTSQLGVAALVTARADTARGVRDWLASAWSAQPELPDRLYPSMRNGRLVTDFDDSEAFMRVVDFTKPTQLYFHSGIAGAFLAGYAQQFGDPSALELANGYLQLNAHGTSAQFDDRTSVQICKYGWGAAIAHNADPTSSLDAVITMAKWFIDRQEPDGSWAPSSFAVPSPGPLDFAWKTSEHLMELSYIEQSLASS